MMDGVLGRVNVDQYDGPTPKVDYNPIIDSKVSHPKHYISSSGLEFKDIAHAFLEDLTGDDAFWTGSAIQYLIRWKKKNGDEDLRKAKQCIDFMLDNHLKEAQ